MAGQRIGSWRSRSLPAVLFLAVLIPGSPLEATTFIRGDSNKDGTLDMSDAIFTLGYLFLGNQGESGCTDALDANDDGETDMSDAIYSLGYLFLGTAAPPPPYPDPGVDPTDDLLECPALDALPAFAGLWNGTFADDEDQYVVVVQLVDEGTSTLVAGGMESIGNKIVGGELYVAEPPVGPYPYILLYETLFDRVIFLCDVSPDGNRLSGEFATESGTSGCGSLVRVLAPLGLRDVAGNYGATFIEEGSSSGIWGGYMAFDATGHLIRGVVAGSTPVAAGNVAMASLDSGDEPFLRDIVEGSLDMGPGSKVHFVGYLAADTKILTGCYEDVFGGHGTFIMEPVDAAEWTP